MTAEMDPEITAQDLDLIGQEGHEGQGAPIDTETRGDDGDSL